MNDLLNTLEVPARVRGHVTADLQDSYLAIRDELLGVSFMCEALNSDETPDLHANILATAQSLLNQTVSLWVDCFFVGA